MPAQPAWWTSAMPDLVSKRELMHSVDKLQSMYVRYKCQPEAQITSTGWDLASSQRFVEQLAAEEQQTYVREESLLYNGLAPTSISLRVVEAPAEFAVPVKQDRRLTPNFKVRAEVGFQTRCSFPLTLKVYVLSQQEKDSVPEWVPDDFMDPELPQRKLVTELKGTTVITHHFEAALEPSTEQLLQQQQQQQQLAAQAAQLLLGGADGGRGINANGDIDVAMVEQVLQEGTRTGAIDPTTAASLSTALISGTTTAVDALSAALGMGPADTTVQVPGSLTQDFEFSAVELVRPTRMNKVYLVFACSVLEQDLLFVVYNIPTVGICRAEQRAKACQKLGIPYSDWGGLDYNTDGPSHSGYSGPKPQGGTGAAAAAAAVAAYASAAQQQQQQSRKRPQPAWGDGMMLPDGLKGSDMAAAAAAAAAAVMAAGGDPNMAIPVQLDGSYMAAQQQGMDAAQLSMLGALPAGLVPSAAAAAGGGGGVSGGGAAAGTPLLSGAGAAAGNAAVGAAVPCSRAALRAQLQQEYEQAGLTRRLTSLDLKALELQAGFPVSSSHSSSSGGGSEQEPVISQQQWQHFMEGFRDKLKLLRLIANVWNKEDPCWVAGFDMEPLGAAQALATQPEGAVVCCLSLEQPGSLVLSCKQPAGATGADASRSGSGSSSGGILQAVVKTEDLLQRRLETWLRDLAGGTHVLDVYRNQLADKRVLLGLNNFTRLRAMDPLDAYDDILI